MIKSETKVIRIFLFLSAIFCSVQIFFSLLIILLQIPLLELINNYTTKEFLFPLYRFTMIVSKDLILLFFFFIVYQSLMQNKQNTKVELASIISVGFIFPIIFSLIGALYNITTFSKWEDNYMAHYSVITSLISYTDILYRWALICFLVACSMSWYYKKYILKLPAAEISSLEADNADA